MLTFGEYGSKVISKWKVKTKQNKPMTIIIASYYNKVSLLPLLFLLSTLCPVAKVITKEHKVDSDIPCSNHSCSRTTVHGLSWSSSCRGASPPPPYSLHSRHTALPAVPIACQIHSRSGLCNLLPLLVIFPAVVSKLSPQWLANSPRSGRQTH